MVGVEQLDIPAMADHRVLQGQVAAVAEAVLGAITPLVVAGV
jgi:hypothetical protein